MMTHPRSASHLLEKMLSAFSNVEYEHHFFVQAHASFIELVQQGPLKNARQETKDEVMKHWQDGFTNNWEPFFKKAADNNKIAFSHFHPLYSLQPAIASSYLHDEGSAEGYEEFVVKSANGDNHHSSDNPEIIPDAELLVPGTVPLINIRHPALLVPAVSRTIREFFEPSNEFIAYVSTLRWQRLVYDFYVKYGEPKGIKPFVIDADDYQGPNREAYMTKLCDTVGLNSSEIMYSWEKASQEELDKIGSGVAGIKRTILGSNKVIEGLDSKSIDLKAEEAKWEGMFGEAGAKLVKDLVQKTMEDYEYLKARKFT